MAALINNLARYRQVFSDAFEVDIRDFERSGLLRWRLRLPIAQRGVQAREFAPVNILRAVRRLTGRDIALRSVSLSHHRDRGVEDFARFFGCAVRFGQDRDVMEFKAADLQLPILTGDSRLLTLLRAHCEDVLARRADHAQTLAERVERLIADRLTAGEARLDVVATELGMSPRTLSRRLAEEATTFNAILERSRRELAQKYLEESNLVLTEIAFLLGYTEISTFSHAFKRWTGASPAAFRRERK